MDLEGITAELLREPLEQFTPRRNARAKELKAAGQAELAREVGGLKKPPVHLWAANQVARQDPSLMRRLQEAARAVARAQTASRPQSPRDLRAASEVFQAALDDAGARTAARLQEDHHAASEEALRRIREIFRLAAMQEGETWKRLQQGALISEPGVGDDVLTMFQAAAPALRKPVEKGRGGAEDPHAARAAERTAQMDAERADQLEETARRLRAEAGDAAAQAERADERARAAEKQAAEARAQAKKSARAIAGRGR